MYWWWCICEECALHVTCCEHCECFVKLQWLYSSLSLFVGLMSQCEGMYCKVKAGNVTALERKSLTAQETCCFQEQGLTWETFATTYCAHPGLNWHLIFNWGLYVPLCVEAFPLYAGGEGVTVCCLWNPVINLQWVTADSKHWLTGVIMMHVSSYSSPHSSHLKLMIFMNSSSWANSLI